MLTCFRAGVWGRVHFNLRVPWEIGKQLKRKKTDEDAIVLTISRHDDDVNSDSGICGGGGGGGGGGDIGGCIGGNSQLRYQEKMNF